MFVDPNDFELVALDTAGDFGGAFIQEIGSKNEEKAKAFAHWTAEEWKAFVKVICGGYITSLENQQSQVLKASHRITVMPMPGGDPHKDAF